MSMCDMEKSWLREGIEVSRGDSVSNGLRGVLREILGSRRGYQKVSRKEVG